MELDNCTKEKFIEWFGEEGYSRIEKHDVRVVLVNNQSAAELNQTQMCAWVGNWMRNGSSVVELALCLNVELMSDNLPGLGSYVTSTRLKHFNGVLIHEITHIEQIKTGRLVALDNHFLWEGTRYEIHTSLAEYHSQPWEKEAHIAQIKYLHCVSDAEAKQIYDELPTA